jgi:predicted nucleic acid-binding protein
MPYVFLDTSALMKLYLPEIGSVWLRNYIIGNQVVISELALFEATTVLRRRYIEGEFTREVAEAFLTNIMTDSLSYEVVPLGGEPQLTRLSDLAFNLNQALRLRALDGLHLVAAGIALEVANALTPPEPLTFVSSDGQLLNVVQSQGFYVENPENHP